MGLCSSADEKQPQHPRRQSVGKKKPRPDELVHLVLIGPGESGKSTIFKQMKLIEAREGDKEGFSAEERAGYAQVIFDDIVSQMRVLLRVAVETKVELTTEEARAAAAKVREGVLDVTAAEMGAICKLLWSDPAVRGVYAMRDQLFNLNDGAPYLFEHIDRIYARGYVPTQDDLLRVRIRTAGTDEATFVHHDFHFRVTDVGGQRSERRRWQEAIDRATALLFCSALTEWDQRLREDPSTVRMKETLMLLRDVLDLQPAVGKPLIVLLTKLDLLREKLADERARNAFRAFFPDYSGPSELTAEAVVAHIKRCFEREAAHGRDLYIHDVVAVDTDNVHRVWRDVRASLVRKAVTAVL